MLVHTNVQDLNELPDGKAYVLLIEDSASRICAEYRHKLELHIHKISNYFDFVYVLQVSEETVSDVRFSTVRVPQLRILRGDEILGKFTGIRDLDSAFARIKEIGLS